MEMRDLLTKSLLEAKLRQAQDLDETGSARNAAIAVELRRGAQADIDKQVEALLNKATESEDDMV